MYLPGEFIDKMKALLKEDYPVYEASLGQEQHHALRVNTNKISVEDFLKISPFSLKKVPWIENGFYYEAGSVRPALHPHYFAGLYYLQEPSAMTPADRLPVFSGDKVLDICAAPGGKATQLAAKLKGSGLLFANDISSSRAKGLLKNLELAGIGNMIVSSETPEKLSGYFPEYFDKILIDAPCSGEGMFRKDKKMVKAWEEHGPKFFSALQKNIITQAASMLKPGGMMMYSTCTFDPSENEEIIEGLLKARPEFTICDIFPYEGFSKGLPLSGDGGEPYFDLSKAVRIYPHRMNGEGHFLALLKKRGEKEDPYPQRAKPRGTGKLPDEFYDFFRDIDAFSDMTRLELRGSRVYHMPEGLPGTEGLRLLRSGFFLGELKKNRFEPSQALAMHLKKEQYPFTVDLPAKDIRVIKFLKGETLDLSDVTGIKDKGWYLFCVDGHPLGFGKLKEGILKNKYPAFWRMMG